MKKYITTLFLFATIIFWANAQISIPYGSTFQYIKGNETTTLPSHWNNASYNAAQWAQGQAPFRYGTGGGGTELTDMRLGYSSIGLRKTFNAIHPAHIEELILKVKYDDGFILWINGVQAVVRNVTPGATFHTVAYGHHSYVFEEEIEIDLKDFNLVEGENTLAVQVFNVSLTDNDLYFDLSLKGEATLNALADSLAVTGFSHKAGFYNEPFEVTITAPDPNVNIWYTTDCSNPQTSSTVKKGTSSVVLRIDPQASGRPKTPTFVLRVSLQQEGFPVSKPVAQSYIFLPQVPKQKNPGSGWPTSNINGQWLDFDMDKDVCTDPRYAPLMDDALLAIPSISITTDLPNLFNPSTGIYVNALNHGDLWERACSVELINPDTTAGFTINAGLRIRGGWSRHDEYPKHAFRLFFRKEYGAGKLKYPLFGDEGVSKFDKIDLRTAQNYAWSNGDRRNIMNREVFARDSQRDLGQPYTRSRYYHLYLNGMYWGLYQTQERSEANFASDYLGGKSDDYDVVKVNGDYTYTIEATDGNLQAWQRVWNLCQKGFTSNANYFSLEGKDAQGNPVKNSEILVNIDNLIDYMMTVFYVGSFDSPISSFQQNQRPNNMYAIYNRADKTNGFTFYAHDFEHGLMYEAVSPGIGINENRVQPSGMNISQFQYFNTQWLHHRLTQNAEYRQRFADRVEKQFFGNGVFTPAESLQRFNARAKEIEMAIIAESARWGDAKTWTPYTKDDHWLPEIERVRTRFFPVRTGIVIKQMQNAKLCPTMRAPQIKVEGTLTETEILEFDISQAFEISKGSSTGKLWVTTNGTDPRQIGGDVNPDAFECPSSFKLTVDITTELQARIQNGSEWSALRSIRLLKKNEDLSMLKFTELHYHPLDSLNGLDTINDKNYEFIELKNTGTQALSLKGLALDTGIVYTFKPNDVLQPGSFYVIASTRRHFYDRYGRLSSGSYKKNLSNAGETITLRTETGETIAELSYTDKLPWEEAADGKGFSLVPTVRNPTGNPSDPTYWKASHRLHGSPFADDPQSTVTVKDTELLQAFINVYPNPASEFLHIHLPNDSAPCDLRFYALNGSLAAKVRLEQSQTLVPTHLNLGPGIYILQASTSKHQQRIKITIQ
jgi:hypothetical protein